MSKPIDPVAIKQAVKDGQLEVFVKRGGILIRDTTTGETVKIGEAGENDE